MPGFDGSGPQGLGPMTGGRRGVCATGSPRTGYNAGYGYGWGRGRRGGFRFGAGFGPGRGFRRFGGRFPLDYGPAYGPISAEDEKSMLKADAQDLQRELEAIQKRIDELEGTAS